MRGRGVEGLGDRDERHLVGVEELDQLGEVGQRAGQAIDLVDHDDVDPAGADVGEQPLQGRALDRAAGEAAIVVGRPDQDPALMGLALDVGLGRLALGVERVEVLLQPVVGRDPGVDGAAQALALGLGSSPGLPATEPGPSPKKRGPLQRVPVMARATCDRLR